MEQLTIFTARRKASSARAVYVAANSFVYPSVFLSVCLSVTLQYHVKTRKCSEMRSSPSDSPVSVVSCCQEWLMEDDPVQVKFECKEIDPLRKEPSCIHFSCHIFHYFFTYAIRSPSLGRLLKCWIENRINAFLSASDDLVTSTAILYIFIRHKMVAH